MQCQAKTISKFHFAMPIHFISVLSPNAFESLILSPCVFDVFLLQQRPFNDLPVAGVVDQVNLGLDYPVYDGREQIPISYNE